LQQLGNAIKNQTEPNDRPFHSWYQFVLGYPPHFVRYSLSKLGAKTGALVLDPFCGTGTTNVECKRLGIDSLGLEANPIAWFASCVKTNWEVSPVELETTARAVASSALQDFKRFGLSEDGQLLDQDRFRTSHSAHLLETEPALTSAQMEVLPRDFISKTPLRKVLILRELILQVGHEDLRNILLLGLAAVTVNSASNLAFGPEIYTSKRKVDAPVVGDFLLRIADMVNDLKTKLEPYGSTRVLLGDARRMTDYFSSTESVDCVITSPPYPNEKDYTRITRLESIVLDFIRDRDSLRKIKANLLRSNSRNVFASDKDDQFVKGFAPVEKLADEIEQRRIRLGKTSGFEKLYHKIVRHYFGGMYRHLASLKELLTPGAKLAYVVGDQRSYFRINIPTAELLGKIAQQLGYRIEGIELWRTRQATATLSDLDENVLILANEG